MVYTIRNMCEEEPDMPYKGNPAKELRELLYYMEYTTEENARNESLKGIHRMVQIVRQDEEMSLEYMKIFEREEMLVKKGVKQGIQQGIQQGVKLEKINTERERRRAEQAEKEVARLKEELAKIKESEK